MGPEEPWNSANATAARYFQMFKESFVNAMQEAPNILFVAAAGNANNDARFDEFIPSAIDLPNTMTAGAVDKAGDEAAFTSCGKVDVYANGYEVDSVLPGGDHLSASGTSAASPQVTNLAAKLFAKYPQLTAVQFGPTENSDLAVSARIFGTAKGRRALREWMASPPRPVALEFEAILRVFLAANGTKDDLLQALDAST